MRLLDTETQELKSFSGKGELCYAILSHTWENDEILFDDMVTPGHQWKVKEGAKKVLGSCQLAKSQGYQYIWIDTCCIDKTSSAELSEAINSMFKWYMEAAVCYVYLTDVSDDGSIMGCRWFDRGWTLQELIAPTSVKFYNQEWHYINDKVSLSLQLATITGIDEALLRCGQNTGMEPPLIGQQDTKPRKQSYGTQRACTVSRLHQLRDYCVAQKMSWASRRQTTRDEDMAYCLMGLFEVNMPLLYGEGGSKAFFRLQREILNTTQDQSILATACPSVKSDSSPTALASGPDYFLNSGTVHLRRKLTTVAEAHTTYSMTVDLTKFGVNVELLIANEIGLPFSAQPCWFGILDCQMGKSPLGRPVIPLHPIEELNDSTIICSRGQGLFEISPEHPSGARDLKALNGWPGPEHLPDLGILDIQNIKKQKITILQSLEHLDPSHYQEGLPCPIQCVSMSSECQPYSVECESMGRAILQNPGYPRLLVCIFRDQNDRVGYRALLWSLHDIYTDHRAELGGNAASAGEILDNLKQRDIVLQLSGFGLRTTDPRQGFCNGSKSLQVSSRSFSSTRFLRVEAEVSTMTLLDWKMPEVTVATTCLGSRNSPPKGFMEIAKWATPYSHQLPWDL
ncbi:hypothetical protein KVR01_011991 [Diaporthe batatas]|uniref:uncharacterized protein n=1 Tax=Diaporthe batatas TaxID=748121 RepID=UPI001D040213|nr:uncharacterized protein KVR01_011991 [Diaporthe batatas]KAG8158230.1 hypothetical protein KVR01_011991 [Diaporthe batatas]